MMRIGSPPRVVERTKVCALCKEEKPWSDFYPRTKWPDGTTRNVRVYCKGCDARKRREAYHSLRSRDPDLHRRYWSQRSRRLKSDPELWAAYLAYHREWKRRRYGYRSRDDEPLMRLVPAGPIAEAFERSGMTLSEVAARMDWLREDGKPDTSRVRRALGQVSVGVSLARGLCEALLVDPVEVGL